MGKGIDLARPHAPEHAALLDDLKDQLRFTALAGQTKGFVVSWFNQAEYADPQGRVSAKWGPVFGKGSCSNEEHDPEKWEPFFGRESCSNKEVHALAWEISSLSVALRRNATAFPALGARTGLPKNRACLLIIPSRLPEGDLRAGGATGGGSVRGQQPVK